MAMTLRAMRLERGLTQRDVAEQMGVQRPAVSKMERKADMSIGRFTEFVEALGGRWQIRVVRRRPRVFGWTLSLARRPRRNRPCFPNVRSGSVRLAYRRGQRPQVLQ
jgi:transcriptional regulator with XRE-family HTH domain